MDLDSRIGRTRAADVTIMTGSEAVPVLLAHCRPYSTPERATKYLYMANQSRNPLRRWKHLRAWNINLVAQHRHKAEEAKIELRAGCVAD